MPLQLKSVSHCVHMHLPSVVNWAEVCEVLESRRCHQSRQSAAVVDLNRSIVRVCRWSSSWKGCLRVILLILVQWAVVGARQWRPAH